MAGESVSGQSGWALTGLAPGALVAGYRVEARIGAGGMAMVLRARDEALGRPVALKILAPARAGDAEFRERFVRESRAVAAVDHPHIIPVYAAGEADGVLYLAMRLVTGGDLRSLVNREGPLPGNRAVALLTPVASALDAAHAAGLVHRDVKPANILVDSGPGRPEHPYLSDFGLAKGSASSTGLTGTGQFLGTPDYAAPEQISGKPARPQTDQYALACVAYSVLTGVLPFPRDESMAVLWAHMYDQPPSVTAARPDLPAAVDVALARALAKAPEERYATCGAFIDALRAALSQPPRAAAAGSGGGTWASPGSSPAEAAGWLPRTHDQGAQTPPRRTQTVPQPSMPDSRAPAVAGPPWGAMASPPPDALGTPAAVLTEQPGDLSPESPSAPPTRWVPPAAPLTWAAPLLQFWRQLAGSGDHPARHRDYDEDDSPSHRRRRWPIVTAALGLLAVLVLAGAFGFWRYNQDQYYLGIDSRTGLVAIFHGTNQSMAGLSMSNVSSESTIRASMLTAGDRAALSQGVSQSSADAARREIDRLASEVQECQLTYQELAAWQRETVRYANYLTARQTAARNKTHLPTPVTNPGAMPTQLPNAGTCAPSTAFGIPASALPTSPSAAG